MFNFSTTAKRMMLIIVVIYLIASIIGSFVMGDLSGIISYMKGLTLGTFAALLKVAFLEHSINRSLSMFKGQADNYSRLSFFIRYLFTGAVLFLVAMTPSIHFFGAVIGIFTLQISAYLVNIIFKIDKQTAPTEQ